MTRVLITGGRGMLGRALLERQPAGLVVLTADLPEVDVASAEAVRECFRDFGPDTVVHCAAMTDVDGCETDPQAAWRANVEASKTVAAACRESVRLVALSTDFVFDGRQTRPYTEADAPAPLSVYAGTKLAGEERVRALAANHAIVRTAWAFAPWGRNFVLAILRAAREQGRLRVVTDQVGSPTYALDLADALWTLAATDGRGTFHVTNAGVVSRYDFAREIVAAAGMAEVPVEPIRSADLGQPATRPAYSALASTRRPALRHYGEALAECLGRMAY